MSNMHTATLITFICASILQINAQSLFCSTCVCKDVGVVVCTETLFPVAILGQPEYYVDQTTNISYNIDRLTFQESNIHNFSTKFPESTLKYLNLNSNSIASITNGVFANLQSLEELVLSNNQLNSIQPDVFQGIYTAGSYMPLKSLKILRLDFNSIHAIDKDLFEHVSHLEVLTLSNNPLTVLDQHASIAIAGLSNLRELNLAYTSITTLPDHFLYSPRNLETLDLSGNNFKDLPATLGQADTLSTLYLNNTGLESIVENGFPAMKSLKVLHLCHAEGLTLIGAHALGELENLEELYLHDNPILEKIDKFALATRNAVGGRVLWPNLKKLHLNNNQLSYLDKLFLARWDALTELQLLGNPWVCECDNQWMVNELVHDYCKIDEAACKEMRCAAPIEMQQYTFFNLSEKQYQMRCLDYYGAEPEKDAAILVGILAGVLISISLVLLAIFGYQRNWFGCWSNGPASYSRRFYSRQATTDDLF